MNWFAVLLFIFNAKTQKGNLLQDKIIIILPKKNNNFFNTNFIQPSTRICPKTFALGLH